MSKIDNEIIETPAVEKDIADQLSDALTLVDDLKEQLNKQIEDNMVLTDRIATLTESDSAQRIADLEAQVAKLSPKVHAATPVIPMKRCMGSHSLWEDNEENFPNGGNYCAEFINSKANPVAQPNVQPRPAAIGRNFTIKGKA